MSPVEAPARHKEAEDDHGGARWRLGAGRADGHPVVLLPGVDTDSRTFCRQAPLADAAPTLALDVPDGGDLDTVVARTLALLPDRPAMLVGASYGGLVARAVAERAPGRVSTLVTIGTLPDPSLRPVGVVMQAALIARLPDRSFDRWYRSRITARLEEEGVPPEAQATHLRGNVGRDRLVARLRVVAAWEEAGVPRVPTWWWRGQVEREAPWTLDDAQQALPHAQVETVPGGHRPWLSHPGALHERLLQVWQNARSAVSRR